MKMTGQQIAITLIAIACACILFYCLGYNDVVKDRDSAREAYDRLSRMYDIIKDTNEVLYKETVDLRKDLRLERQRTSAWKSFAVSTWDYELMCRLVEAEAGNQDSSIKTKVAAVILNRVKYPNKFGNNIMEVMTAPGQFSPIGDGTAYETDATDDTYSAVNEAILTGNNQDLLFFMTPAVAKHQDYFRSLRLIEQTKDLNFYGFHKE